MAWLNGWRYRKAITLSRADGAVTSYQMRMLLGESSGASGEDVDCGALCKSDFSDIRFTTSDGTTLLDYWIESINGTTPNQLVAIWIEFDSIGTGATTFFMYYGNTGAAAVSDGDNTFEFFDDFPGSSLDTASKWDLIGGSVSVSSSIAQVVSTTGRMRTKATFPVDRAFYASIKYLNNSNWAAFGFQNADTYGQLFYVNYFTVGVLNAINRNPGVTQTSNNLGNIGDGNVFKIYEIKRNSTSDVRYIADGTANTNSGNLSTISIPIEIFAQAQDVYVGFVFLRKWLVTDPEWGSWGSEEVEDITDIAGAGDISDAFSLTDGISDAAGLGDAVEALSFAEYLTEGAGLGDGAEAIFEVEAGASDTAGIGDAVSAGYELESDTSDGSGFGDSSDAFNWTDWLAQNLDKAVARYYCTITGAADGEDDVEVPISSFQARKRNGYSTYLSVVIPGVAYADAISDRANGEIVIDMAYLIGGVESLREEILRADLEQINIYEGTTSRSITLIGHQEQTFVAKESRLYDPIYKQLVDGELSFRFAAPDLWLNPGDTARVGDDAFTVDTVVYMVAGGGGQNVMEVQE